MDSPAHSAAKASMASHVQGNQCTSRTERIQLALMDRTIGLKASYLKAEEQSLLDAISQDTKTSKNRMFFLTGDERAVFDGASDDEVEQDIALPSSPSSAEMQMNPQSWSQPVDTADMLQDTVKRCLSLPLSCIGAAAAVLHSSVPESLHAGASFL